MNVKGANEMARRIRGLSPGEVQRSKELHGDNGLTRIRDHSFFREFIRNFGDPLIKILLIALVINVVIKIRDFDWYESIGIAAAILISTLVSTLSEYGSEEAFNKLQADALKTRCRVKRAEGVLDLPVTEVVVGDYVLLQAGDRVPADGTVCSGEVYVDQSPLNGESKEARKAPGGKPSAEAGDLSDPRRIFRGCIVTSGEAVMAVGAVGAGTFYGRIAHELQEDTRESPLKARLGKLAGSISRLGYAGAALVAFAHLFYAIVIANGFRWADILACLKTPGELTGYLISTLTLAISVIVVAVPEGLPLMITVVLSSNMKRMLRDNVLVRKLVGIETSGSLNILFTDKTGTLTKGRLKVAQFMTGGGVKYDSYGKLRKTGLGHHLGIGCSLNTGATLEKKGRAIGGNATERALLEFLEGDVRRDEALRVADALPFSSVNKYSAVKITGDYEMVLYKGAPELILSKCNRYFDENGMQREMNARARLRTEMARMTEGAYRLLALAEGRGEINREGIPEGLTLVGIVAIRDEVRREAVKAVAQVTRAGIQVVMITGDNRETAAAIAREVGLIQEEAPGRVLTSADLAAMSDEAVKRALPKLRVVARAVPSDKSRLVRLAQELGLVAGMTGDGINDAPALKRADVGFAMGSGTEVAKEASDIVILDDNFLSIAKAVLYGRTIFKSIRKFIIFQLTINLCAVGVSVIGPFIGVTSPITVLQMLWVNMVMDTLAGLAFAGEPPLPEYMNEPPKRRDEPIINRYMLNQILVVGGYVTLLSILFLKLPFFRELYHAESGRGYFMTAYFAMFIFAGVFNSFNARTTRLNLLAHIWRNKAFMGIMLFVAIVQIGIIYFGGAIFRTTGLSLYELEVAILLALTVIPVDFMRKRFMNKGKRGNAI